MRRQKTEGKGIGVLECWSVGYKKIKTILHYSITPVFLLLLAVYCLLPTAVFASEKWPGVDESVVEKFAKEHGREAKDPLINTDQGDLLLFVFLLAGAVGGFVAGYYWRTLTEIRSQSERPSAETRIGKPEVRIQTTENR